MSNKSLSGRSEGDSHLTPIKGDGGAVASRRRGSASANASLVDNNNNDGSSVGSSWAPGYDTLQPQQQQQEQRQHQAPSRFSTPSRGNFSESFNSPSRPPINSRRRQQQQQQQQQRRTSTEDHPLSIQDRVVQAASATGSTALFSTLELLKILGSTTLNTTGKLVAPPLQVTREVILPAIWSALKDYIKYISPQRLKDWFRIVSSSLHHFVTVVKDTPKGIVFRKRLFTVGNDLVDCVSCDASRQVIIDGMATIVKFSEAMHTPECKALLEQFSVLGCRLMDAVAVGRNKQLLHDFNQAIWAGLEMASDPSTTLALAEVTACLCHALEMEETIHRNRKPKSGAAAAAARRRYERNQFQRQTYVDVELTQDPDSTVEEVILSSLGAGGGRGGGWMMNGPPAGVAPSANSRMTGIETDQESLPSNVMFGPQDTASASGMLPPMMGDTASTGQDNGNSNVEEVTYEEEWKRVSSDAVDVNYLQQQISQRAASMERKHMLRTTIATPAANTAPSAPQARRLQDDELRDEIEDLVVEAVEDGEEDDVEGDVDELLGTGGQANGRSMERQTTFQQSNKKPVSTVDVAYEDLENARLGEADEYERDHTPPPLHSIETAEPATSRFYRSLDELLARKRSDAINEVLASGRTSSMGETGNLQFHPKAAAAAGAGNEDGMETLKSRIQRLMFNSNKTEPLSASSMIGVGRRPNTRTARGQNNQLQQNPQLWLSQSQKPSRLQLVVVAVALVVMLIWFILGCYGLWMILYPGVSRAAGSVVPFWPEIRAWLSQPRVPLASTTSASNEIVIRVVKEVVHKTSDGKVLLEGLERHLASSTSHSTADSVIDTAKVAECVAEAVK